MASPSRSFFEPEPEDFDLDLEGVDFSLQQQPTLDSILNESDEDDSQFLDMESLKSVPNTPTMTRRDFVGSDNLLLDTPTTPSANTALPSRRKATSPQKGNKYGKIMRIQLMGHVSQHIANPNIVREVGAPTVISATTAIAVGTTKGYALIYDQNQKLRCTLGNPSLQDTHGAVTAIAVNGDETRLLVGHANGQVVRWDMSSGKTLNTMSDMYKSPVLIVSFTDDHNFAISANAEGAVYVHAFKRLVGVRVVDNICIFQGGKEAVCSLAVLDTTRRPLPRDMTLVAIGSLSKILICTTRPETKVLFSVPRDGADAPSIPTFSWCFVPIRLKSGSMYMFPVLAFSWGSSIIFCQIAFTKNEQTLPRMIRVGTYKGSQHDAIVHVEWLNDKTLCFLDDKEMLRVLDVKSMTVVESIDVKPMRLTYNALFAKVNGLKGLRSFRHSFAYYNGVLHLLSNSTLHSARVYTWKERIGLFANQYQFVEALQFAMGVYRDTAPAIVGLPKNPEERKAVVREQVLDLLHAYVDISVAAHVTESEAEARTFFEGVVSLCISYTLQLDALPVLFSTLYDKLALSEVAAATFFTFLVPLIKEDKITSMTAIVLQDFVAYFEREGKLGVVEECIVHLDVANLDINQMVVLCWTNGLYDAMIYVYTRGLHDYLTPLRELVTLLAVPVKERLKEQGRKENFSIQMSKHEQKIGYKLLLYISYCLSGLAFPKGFIPHEYASQVKFEVYRELTTRSVPGYSWSFPTTRILLLFDTKEFLNVLSIAFTQHDDVHSLVDAPPLPSRQQIVDILLEIMVQEPSRTGSNPFGPEQLGTLFTFLARQMAIVDHDVTAHPKMFEQVLEYLSNPNEMAQHEERQQALLELINAGGLSHVDEDKLFRLAENAKFYRICEMILLRRGEPSKVIKYYLLEQSKAIQVFPFIHHAMQDSSISESEISNLKHATTQRLPDLVKIDTMATGRLLLLHYASELGDIISMFSSTPPQQYDLLSGIYTQRATLETPPMLSPEVHELYLTLMCRYHPTTVYGYLLNTTDNYRLEECLAICLKHGVTDASAWLYERKGDIEQAFSLMLTALQEKITKFGEAFKERDAQVASLILKNQVALVDSLPDDRAESLKSLRAILAAVLRMCTRVSPLMEEHAREGIWFKLLDSLFDTLKTTRPLLKHSAPEYARIIRDLARAVVNSMIHHIKPPLVLQRLMAGSFARTFGDIKDLLLGMLETFNYEETLLTTTNKILFNDLYFSLRQRSKNTRRGMRPTHRYCEICHCGMGAQEMAEKGPSTVFACGHFYHLACMQMVLPRGDVVCYICRNSDSGSRKKQKGQPSVASEPSTFSLRDLVESVDEPSRPEARSLGALTTFQYEQLKKLQRATQAPSRLRQLEEIEAFLEGRGPLPLSENALSSRPEFQLKTAIPRSNVPERVPRQQGRLPEHPHIQCDLDLDLLFLM